MVLFTIRFSSSNNEVKNLVVIAIRELVGTKMDNFHDYIGILQGLQHLLSGWPHVTRNFCAHVCVADVSPPGDTSTTSEDNWDSLAGVPVKLHRSQPRF